MKHLTDNQRTNIYNFSNEKSKVLATKKAMVSSHQRQQVTWF
jgi:hypothetical protein